MSFRIYGITYGDKKTDYLEYRNHFTEKMHRFEYNPMIDICDNLIADLSDNDYLGIFSWKFGIKTGLTKKTLVTLLNGIPSEVDVLNLSPNLGNNIAGYGCFMDWSCAGHGETLRHLIKSCCDHTGLKYYNNPKQVVYANQFVAKKNVYMNYMNNVIKPSLELLEGYLWKVANTPAKYTAGVDSSSLKKQTGLDFYNYVPFVLERMMMQYIANKPIKTIWLT